MYQKKIKVPYNLERREYILRSRSAGWWLVLICCERKILLAGWWLMLKWCERKALLAS
jgi:hypothetical protein